MEPDLDPGDRVVGRIHLWRIIDDEGGMRDDVATDDGDDEALDIATAVGMLAMAQHTMLCEHVE